MWKLLLMGYLLLASTVRANFTNNCQGEYIDGAKQGFWKCYYEDGKVQQEGEYLKDEKSGHWKFYHASGILALEGNYTADRETGQWIVYNEEKIIKLM